MHAFVFPVFFKEFGGASAAGQRSGSLFTFERLVSFLLTVEGVYAEGEDTAVLAFSVTDGVGFVYAVGEVDNFGELDDSSLGTS